MRFPGRRFELWAYAVSHRQLLLRSNKSAEHPLRCEILFKNVSHVNVPAWIDDLEIEAGSEEMAPGEAEDLRSGGASDKVLYRIRGNGFSGHVIAGNLTYTEDDGEYHDPSSLLET